MDYIYWYYRSDYPAIVELVLQRETVMNAFNTQMARELIKACQDIEHQGDVRAVILRSSSSRAFCTGADLKERNCMNEREWRHQHRIFEEMFYSLADLTMPTIAVIDGYCLAGGMELALNCDLWVVSDKAVFGLPEVTRGIMPGGGATRLLSRRMGLHFAKEMILTGGKFTADDVNRMGLVNRLASQEELEEASLHMAGKIAENAPLSVSYCKKALDELTGYPDEIGREKELNWYNKCLETEDRYEGIRAFNERRLPKFEGR